MACHDEPGMLTVATCRERLLNTVVPLAGSETVALAQAVGRVLADALSARIDSPPADNSAMDGYAVHADDLASDAPLHLVGSSAAGHPWTGTLQPGESLRILTGAVVPAGASAVIMQEDILREPADSTHIRLGRALSPGENIRSRGEDIGAGDALLPAGRQLTPADIGLLASQGIASVSVRPRLRIALLSTGDELVPPGQPLAPGQIHDSNRVMLQAALLQAGFEVLDLGHVRDELDALRSRFADADRLADAVITSGGVSVGDADLVRQVVGELGDIRVWKIAIKPGKPFAFGTLPNSLFFGLPGNPVSALVTLEQLAMPALRALQGTRWQPAWTVSARLLAPVRKKPGRAEYQRGVLNQRDDGAFEVMPLAGQGSGLLTSLSRANCYLVLDQDQGRMDTGEPVRVQPF